MNPADERDPRDLVPDLSGALAPVLADLAPEAAVAAARAAARGLGLDGLDRLLGACAPHAGHPWPAELAPALERLRRLAARALETGSHGTFRAADRELAGLADEISALQWSPAWRADSDEARPVATLSLADTLDDLPLADDAARELARRVRLLPPVAAALRAALDWLTGDSGRPLALRAEESLLEVTCGHVGFDGLTAATEVLAAVGGNLGPGPGVSGAWMVRVPIHTGRDVYLMLVHGGVPIAIPWHAVLRMHMAGAAEMAERESLGGWPLVKGPLGGALPPAGESPLALVAHGRKRGWLVADRLVWRLHAEPVALTERAPAAGLAAMVETEEGERYWLAEPGWLLRSLEAPSLVKPESRSAPEPWPAPEAAAAVAPPGGAPGPPPPPAPAVASQPAPEAMPAPLAPAPAAASVPVPEAMPAPPAPAPAAASVPVPEVAPAPPAPAPAAAPPPPAPPPPGSPPRARVEPPPVPRSAPQLRLLTSDEVVPLEADEHPVSRWTPVPPPSAPARPPAPAPAPPPREPGVAHRPTRTALIAEDSITARIFLARLLARLDFDVCTVDTAAALRAELERGAWSLACVDIELPDEAGTAFLAGLVARHGERTPFVALVRDLDDRVAARRAGIERMLRKPFDTAELEQVLARLGLVPHRAP